MVVDRGLLNALVTGVLQGIFEWLSISCEGNVAALWTIVGASSDDTVR